MQPVELKTRRELFWDEFLVDEAKGVAVEMHYAQPRGVALTANMLWEGNVSGYTTVFADGNIVRMYYRGADLQFDFDGNVTHQNNGCICYAESRDGKTFYRPELGICEHNGSRKNNIILNDYDYDNFSVFKDANPACPPQELYKGLSAFFSEDGNRLKLFVSPDGLHFTFSRFLDIKGFFDTLNIGFYDTLRGEYLLYTRSFHKSTGEEGTNLSDIRDIRVTRSPDLIHFSQSERLDFGDAPDYQLYTNNVRPYVRAPHIYLGAPMRYIERTAEGEGINFRYLPDRENRMAMSRLWGRSGYAMTDCVLMTTRDGLNFRRTDEAFMTPGPETAYNWYYGDCALSNGIVITRGERDDCPDEISFYMGRNYRVADIEFMRYAVRLDGFFSWSAGYRGGSVLSKPLTFEGSELHVNFATSAQGTVRITLCDESGKPIEGYRSAGMFGDSTRRRVDFAKPLSQLAGKPIRMLFEMSDAKLYSMKFSEGNGAPYSPYCD